MISKNNRLIFQEAYGNRIQAYESNASDDTSSSHTKKTDIHTIYDLASVTKMFTTTIILRLISKKDLSLDTRLGDCLPQVHKEKNLKKSIANITIKQLLTHSSGIGAWHAFYSEGSKAFYSILNKILPPSSLHKGVIYSDINFMLLGEVIQNVTNQSLRECMQEMVVQPLDLKTLDYGFPSNNNIAATEFGNRIEKQMCADRNLPFTGWRNEKSPIVGEVHDGNCHYYFKGVSGHAGLFSSAADALKLGQLFIEEGEWEGASLINKELVKMSMEVQVESRGLGWEITDTFPNGCGHTGFTGTSLWVVPEEKMVVVTLTNRVHIPKPALIQKFRKELHHEILKNVKGVI